MTFPTSKYASSSVILVGKKFDLDVCIFSVAFQICQMYNSCEWFYVQHTWCTSQNVRSKHTCLECEMYLYARYQQEQEHLSGHMCFSSCSHFFYKNKLHWNNCCNYNDAVTAGTLYAMHNICSKASAIKGIHTRAAVWAFWKLAVIKHLDLRSWLWCTIYVESKYTMQFVYVTSNCNISPV